VIKSRMNWIGHVALMINAYNLVEKYEKKNYFADLGAQGCGVGVGKNVPTATPTSV
jgi:hypothetical protein